jgi:hypothetical protein
MKWKKNASNLEFITVNAGFSQDRCAAAVRGPVHPNSLLQWLAYKDG